MIVNGEKKISKGLVKETEDQEIPIGRKYAREIVNLIQLIRKGKEKNLADIDLTILKKKMNDSANTERITEKNLEQGIALDTNKQIESIGERRRGNGEKSIPRKQRSKIADAAKKKKNIGLCKMQSTRCFVDQICPRFANHANTLAARPAFFAITWKGNLSRG